MGRGETHRQGDRERQRQEKLLGKKKEWPVRREKEAGITGKGTGNSTAAQTARGQGQALPSPARAALQGHRAVW